eukprot:CAMPEP_0174912852 /NCGR_PEP_ID=MMETSP0167-20121228/80003_1 /TAXON_ID=38298 /ORGANISM="Rhodella maculata, Strain CCMP736" /LENGTH=453 /DNA_ID=CAMNT_0016157525 /DNA_START=302 /DNA_END=1664 /DNA_ORIENTATION=-
MDLVFAVESGAPRKLLQQQLDFVEHYTRGVKALPEGFCEDRIRSVLFDLWGSKGSKAISEATCLAKNKENFRQIRKTYFKALPTLITEIPSGKSLPEMFKNFLKEHFVEDLKSKDVTRWLRVEKKALKDGRPVPDFTEYVEPDLPLPRDFQYTHKDVWLLLAFKCFRTSSFFVKDVGNEATDKIMSRAMIKEDEAKNNPVKKANREHEVDHVRVRREISSTAKDDQSRAFLQANKIAAIKAQSEAGDDAYQCSADQSRAFLQANKIAAIKAQSEAGDARLQMLVKLKEFNVYSQAEFNVEVRMVVGSLPALKSLKYDEEMDDEVEDSEHSGHGATNAAPFAPRDPPPVEECEKEEGSSGNSPTGGGDGASLSGEDAREHDEDAGMRIEDVAVLEAGVEAPAYRIRDGKVRRICGAGTSVVTSSDKQYYAIIIIPIDHMTTRTFVVVACFRSGP